MVRSATFAVALLLCLVVRPAHAQDRRWVVLITTKTRAVSIDTLSLRSPGPKLVRAWLRTDFIAPQTRQSTKPVVRQLARVDFDCGKGMARTLQQIEYDAEGLVAKDWNPGEPAWETITWDEPAPDSVGDVALRRLCAA